MIENVTGYKIEVLNLTGIDAMEAWAEVGADLQCDCFTTEDMGGDGLIWTSIADFESEYEATFGESPRTTSSRKESRWLH